MATNGSVAAAKRVLMVDDHELVREGLRMIIETTADLMVCADVGDAAGGREAVAELRPDVAVVDLALMPGGSEGLGLVQWISTHHPHTRCIVSSMHDERLYGLRALRAGACGYVSKSAPAQAVVDAIRMACRGRLYFSQALLQVLRNPESASSTGASATEQLSDRELQVFRAIGHGQGSKEIAAALNVSVSTVDTYRERLKAKLSLASGAELLHCATRWVIENS